MMQAMITLGLDVLMAILLVTTITYCVKLNRRILVLQDSKGDMAQLIRQFDEATQKASESISELGTASRKLQEDMGAKIQKANFIADDLAFMIEKGNKVAERMLGSGSATAPQAQAKPAAPQPAAGIRLGSGARPTPNLSADNQSEAPVPRGPRINPDPAPRTSALDSVMNRLGKNDQPAPRPAAEPATSRNRSKAEQELLDALKNDV